MKIVSSKVGCYFSTMIFFNALHILKIYNDEKVEPCKWTVLLNSIKNKEWVNPSCNNIEILLLVIEIIIGAVFLAKIIIHNDDKRYENTKGRTYTIIDFEDKTQCEYFGKYSLLILTSISLPTNNNLYSFFIFFFVQITIGIVYVYYNLIYINPILSLLKYRIYSCRCTYNDTEKKSLVVITRRELKEEKEINIRNTNNTVIKLGVKK